MSLEATIKISPETRAALNALKRGGESQDAVIRRLICDHVRPIFDELAKWMQPLLAPILEGEYVPQTILSQRPDPSIDTLGLLWQTRETGNNKTKTWQCVQNSAGDYEWIQTGVST